MNCDRLRPAWLCRVSSAAGGPKPWRAVKSGASREGHWTSCATEHT